ncbi:hypothetical protein [Chitinimonas naiadis]
MLEKRLLFRNDPFYDIQPDDDRGFRYGKPLIYWLLNHLKPLGYTVAYRGEGLVYQDDWGWTAVLTGPATALRLRCVAKQDPAGYGNADGSKAHDDLIWGCLISTAAPWYARLFNGSKHQAAIDTLYDQVSELLQTHFDIEIDADKAQPNQDVQEDDLDNLDIYLTIPGTWAGWKELTSQLQPHFADRYELHDTALIDRRRKVIFQLSLGQHDPELARRFARSSSVSKTELARLGQHRSVITLISRCGDEIDVHALQEAATVILKAGGLGVLVENTAVGHGPDYWLDCAAAPPPGFGTFYAFVSAVDHQDTHTAGMHFFGLPDIVFTRGVSEQPASLLHAAGQTVLRSRQPFTNGDTIDTGNLGVYRLSAEPCRLYERDDPSFNPFGVWRLTPVKQQWDDQPASNAPADQIAQPASEGAVATLLIPGAWADPMAILDAILAAAPDEYSFTRDSMIVNATGEELDMTLVRAVTDLADIFTQLCDTRYGTPGLDQFASHTFVLKLSLRCQSQEDADTLIAAADAVIAAGGMGVLLELNQLAHTAPVWRQFAQGLPETRAFRALVTYRNADEIQSVGMHHFGLRDTLIDAPSLHLDEVMDVITTFNRLQITGELKVKEAADYSVGQRGRPFRAYSEPCTHIPDDHASHNPYGVWRLIAVAEESTQAQQDQSA